MTACLGDPASWSDILRTAARCAGIPYSQAPATLWYGLGALATVTALVALVLAVVAMRGEG